MTYFPDFDKNIVSLSNSILKFFGAKTHHSTLVEADTALSRGKRNVVFMILDGLGENILQKHLPPNSFLRQHHVCPISSVFPPTTAAATTSFHSGKYPIEHGWIGWAPYFKEYNKVIEIFLNNDFYTHKPLDISPVGDMLPYKSIYHQIIEQNPEVQYHKVFPPFDPEGVKTFAEMCQRIPQIIKQNDNLKIISAYWPDPDHHIHYDGVEDIRISKLLQNMDMLLSEMVAQLKDTIVIISADHGIIDIEEKCLNDYPELVSCLKLPPSIESRFTAFFIKDGQHQNFIDVFNRLFAADFKLFTKEEFFNSGLLGRGIAHAKINDFIGDFIAVGISNKNLRYQISDDYPYKHFAAEHAGLTKAELMVPLIIYIAD